MNASYGNFSKEASSLLLPLVRLQSFFHLVQLGWAHDTFSTRFDDLENCRRLGQREEDIHSIVSVSELDQYRPRQVKNPERLEHVSFAGIPEHVTAVRIDVAMTGPQCVESRE